MTSTMVLEQAVRIMNDGGIVIFPTDTAFGIGCRVDDPQAVERLFRIRRRPAEKATPVLVSSIEMALSYWKQPVPDEVTALTHAHWPGALTIVYPGSTEKIPALVRGGGTTVGLRMPNHPVALSLIKGVGVPILGPSANFHGNPTPFSVDMLDPELVALVDGVLPGTCTAGNVSTVVDCSVKPWNVLRQGAVEINF